MLCCFGRPAAGQKPVSARKAGAARPNTTTKVEEECQVSSSKSFVPEAGPLADHLPWGHGAALADVPLILEEPWRARLSQHLLMLVAEHSLRAAGCWVCSKDGGKCYLLAAAPSMNGSFLRSALHGFFLGSAIDVEIDRTSSVACAVSTKVPIIAVVQSNAQPHGDFPADLRQLYERICRPIASARAEQNNVASTAAWLLAALPLFTQGAAVGALVVVEQLEVPAATPGAGGSALQDAADAAIVARRVAAAKLEEEFFGSPAKLECAQNVASLAAAVSAAPDHASAVRNAATQIRALLPVALAAARTAADATTPRPPTISPTASPWTCRSSSPTPPTVTAHPPQYQLIVTTGLVVSRGGAAATARPCNPSSNTGPTHIPGSSSSATTAATTAAAAAAASSAGGGGPQLHLYCGANGKLANSLPVSETLITRAPIRAEALAAMLSEALAAPVSSAGLSAGASAGVAAYVASGSGTRGTLLTLRCPEDELPPSKPRADLAALEAAGARAPRGSVVLVSCPLLSIVCTVVAYVCVVPSEALGKGAAGADTDRGGGPARGSPGAHVGMCMAAADASVAAGAHFEAAANPLLSAAAQPEPAAQLPEAHLRFLLSHVSSAMEVLAGALEQRLLASCCAASPTRLGSRGPCTLDVTADTSGFVTVSGTDADDSNGFWGSASGLILSGESIPPFQYSPAVGGGAGASSAAGSVGFSFGRSPDCRPLAGFGSAAGCASAITPGPGRVGPLAMSCFAASRVNAAELCAAATAEPAGEAEQTGGFALSAEAASGSRKGGGQDGARRRAVDAPGTTGGATSGGAAGGSGAPALPAGAAAAAAAGGGSACYTKEAGMTVDPEEGRPSQGKVTNAATANIASNDIASNDIASNDIASNDIASNDIASNDIASDVAQDNAIAGGAAKAVSVATGVRGVSGSAAVASSSSTSGFSGVESAINALDCGHIDGCCGSGGGGHRLSEARGPVAAPVAVQLTAAPVLLTRAFQPVAAAPLLPPCGAAAAALPNGDPLCETSPRRAGAAAATAAPTAAQQGGPSSSIGLPAAAGGPVLAPGQGWAQDSARAVVEEGAAVPRVSGSTGGSVSGVSGESLPQAMVRNRSKDWSDQAEQPESPDGRFAAGSGSATTPRLRPIKVLSLNKAAQQLQRSLHSSGANATQPMPLPPPQIQLLLQPLQQQQPGLGPTSVQNGVRDGAQALMPHANGAAAAVGATAGAAAAAPPPYVPFMPRRLNRMYLQPGTMPGAAAADAGSSGVSGNFPGADTKATIIARPQGALGTSVPIVAAAASPPPASPPVQLTARAVERDGGSGSGLAGAALRPQVLSATPMQSARLLPTASNGGAKQCMATLSPTGLASREPHTPPGRTTVPLVELLHAATPALVSSPAAGPALPAPRYVPPSSAAASAAAVIAAARAAGIGIGGESPAASANSQKSRQLSDYAIPEDASLEYTVSETVQMMRVLAQARGAHLSSRMRRVRVTAKIQSAHPESLPADLPSQLAKAALLAPHNGGGGAAAGLFSSGGGGNGGGTWVLTGVAARRGCIELVFDVVQVRSSGSEPGGAFGAFDLQLDPGATRRRVTSPVTGNSCNQRLSPPQVPSAPQGLGSGADAANARLSQVLGQGNHPAPVLLPGRRPPLPQPQLPVPGSGCKVYRRWHGAADDGALKGSPYPLEGLGEELAAEKSEEEEADGERRWLCSTCGVRPEAVAEVLQGCGLLSSSSGPFVDVQIGLAAAGAVTLVWHEAARQWVSAAGVDAAAAGGGCADATPAESTPPASSSALEAPTLWLPCSVVLLARGARSLQNIRLVSTSGGGALEVADEVTVRSVAGFLPVHVASSLRLHTGAGSGSSQPPLPLTLEDDPVVSALADGPGCWRLLDVGGPLPRNGGLLLIECRRTAVGPGRCGGGGHPAGIPPSSMDPPTRDVAAAAGAITSAPVPLLVLPEQHVAAAGELQLLRLYMARTLLGSEDALRQRPPASSGGRGAAAAAMAAAAVARAEAAAQVEMACQQFLMDLGVLLDAAAAAVAVRPAAAPAAASAATTTVTSSEMNHEMLLQVAARGCAGPGPGGVVGSGGCAAVLPQPPHSFSEARSASQLVRAQLPELHISPVCSSSALSSMPSCSSPLTMFDARRVSGTMMGWASEPGGGYFSSSGLCRFVANMDALMQARAPGSMKPNSGGELLAAASAGGGGVTQFGEHLMDVACTVLAGCCAGGLRCTALLVLRLACEELNLAAPEALLAEAGADTRVGLELLAAYATQARQHGTGPDGGGGSATSAVAATTAGASAAVCKAMAGHAHGGGGAAAATAAPRQGQSYSNAECRTASGFHVAANSTNSRSHSLALMLLGPRADVAISPPTPRQPDGSGLDEFSGWPHTADLRIASAAQPWPAAQGQEQAQAAEAMTGADWRVQQQRIAGISQPMASGGGMGLGATGAEADGAMAWQGALGATMALGSDGGDGGSDEQAPVSFLPAAAVRGALAPRALHVALELTHGDLLPTWGSLSAAGTPDSAARNGSRSRFGSHLLGSDDEATMAVAAADEAAAAAAHEAAQETAGLISAVADMAAAPPLLHPAAETQAVGSHVSATASAAPQPLMAEVPLQLRSGLSRRSARALGAGTSSSRPPSRPPSCTASSGSSGRVSPVRSSGAGCFTDPAPPEELIPADEDDAAAVGRGALMAVDTAVARRHGAPSLRRGWRWAVAGFSESPAQRKYLQFVATRTCGVMWSYFICNVFISVVSCTRAWLEDGLDGCLTLLVFSGLQGVAMGWYCVARGACDARAMVAAAVACKGVRLAADLLMATRLLTVPSLMGPMAVRGVEILSEALIRPMAERVPLVPFCLMSLLELPCVWLLYCRFRDIFPAFWLRDQPALRTAVFALLSGFMNSIAEIYWRREFRKWLRSRAGVAAGGALSVLAAGGGAGAEEGVAVCTKPFRKDE